MHFCMIRRIRTPQCSIGTEFLIVRLGAHPAFWGPYMTRLFDFLKEADAESIRRAKEITTEDSVIVFSSDEDLPLSPGQEDRRKVRKRDTRPLSQPGLIDGPATEPTPMEMPVETKIDSLMDKPPEAKLPAGSDTEIMPHGRPLKTS